MASSVKKTPVGAEKPKSVLSSVLFWSGWVLTALPALALLVSGITKLLKVEAVMDGFKKLEFPPDLVVSIGVVELVCLLLYLFPRTAILGAILVTGYFGGATATNVRVGENFIPPIVLGVMVWGGLFLRDRRLRAILPWRS
jgi:xanthine/uracil permease